MGPDRRRERRGGASRFSETMGSLKLTLNRSMQTYPIQNTKQGVPPTILRRNAHLRPRASAAAAMLRVRSEMAWSANNHLRVSWTSALYSHSAHSSIRRTKAS